MNKNIITFLFVTIILNSCFTVLKHPSPKSKCEKLTNYQWTKSEWINGADNNGIDKSGVVNHYLDFNNFGEFYYWMSRRNKTPNGNYECIGDTLVITRNEKYELYLINFEDTYLELTEVSDVISERSNSLYPRSYEGKWRRK